ncbi:MAG TPA: hypothetical protein PLP21_05390 [Pyrinomonadaceae bacterium]|nr:hypothetical protein [Acidobacteriota bacterium]HQZ95729.1 hypothetical protein [Pyrinomonadaceae bacterium]
MKRYIRHITFFSLIATLAIVNTAQAQVRPYRVSDRQVQTLLTRIENRTNTFKDQIDRALDNSNIDGTGQEDSINTTISNFENTTDRLRNNLSSNRSSANDVQDVLQRAAFINSFMRSNRLSTTVQSSWTAIRTDLNTLARYYRVSTNWNAPVITRQNVYIGTDTQVRNLITQIANRTKNFKSQISRNLNNSNIDGTNREDSINTMVSNFESATNRLKNNFSSRRSTTNDVQEVLNRAVAINAFIANNRLSNPAENSWNQIRNDLNTLAGYYRVSANWNAPVGGSQNVYIGSDSQIRNLFNTIETRTNTFKQQISRNLNNSNIDDTNREDSINTMVANFELATNRLRNNFSSRISTTDDVQDVLNRAVPINSFVANNRLSNAAETSWNQIRTDLNTLAGYYRVSSNWNNTVVTPGGGQWGNGGNFDSRLTGTYRLNVTQSDNVATMIDRAMTSAQYQTNTRDRMRTNLERRLRSPETLTFEKRGQSIMMSSSNAQSVTLNADGVGRTETSPNGRTVTTTVISNNREVTINYDGDRSNDFYLTFTPTNNNQLRVTRRVYLENTDQTITVSSVYDKTSQTAEWNNNGGQPNYNDGGATGGFIIPNNTGITATLDTPLSTRSVKDGDRFSMTVNSPSQYNGVIIEGTVDGQKSGVVSGRATMSLNFQTIRMRDGRTYTFSGIVEQVRETNGNVINVNNEGAIRDRSQTTTTATRAGVGAILGAIIGAIAGGGSGAAIGAGVGAGAGAGTVVLQGRDNLELAAGSLFTITATAPANQATR